MKKLFVRNINWNATKEDIEVIFSKIGELQEVVLLKDEAGRSRGIAFVTFTNEDEGEKAIKDLDGFEIDGRPMFVQEARPQEKRERKFDRR